MTRASAATVRHPGREDVGKDMRVLAFGYFNACRGLAREYHSFCGAVHVCVEFADDPGRLWYFKPTELEVVS